MSIYGNFETFPVATNGCIFVDKKENISKVKSIMEEIDKKECDLYLTDDMFVIYPDNPTEDMNWDKYMVHISNFNVISWAEVQDKCLKNGIVVGFLCENIKEKMELMDYFTKYKKE